MTRVRLTDSFGHGREKWSLFTPNPSSGPYGVQYHVSPTPEVEGRKGDVDPSDTGQKVSRLKQVSLPSFNFLFVFRTVFFCPKGRSSKSFTRRYLSGPSQRL